MNGNVQLPSTWISKRLKYVASHNDDVLPADTEDLKEIDYVEISGVSLSGGIEEINRMTFFEAPSRARRKVRKGDILVSTVRTYLKAIATVQDASDDLIASTGFCVIRSRGEADAGFLGWVAKSEPFVSEVVARSVGVSYPAINASELVDIEVPLPPLDIQKRIAAFLEDKTSRIDVLFAKKQALLARLAEKRRAIITQAVTKGLKPAASRKESGIPWLGQIPAHWKVKRLRFLVKLLSGATPTTGMTEYWDGDINWISPKDVKVDEITDTIDKVTNLAIEDYGLRRFDDPNVVIVIRGMILARYVPVSIASGTYTINQDMKVMKSKGEIVPWYLQLYLAAIQGYLMTLIAEAGHGTKALRTDVLMDTPILVPPVDEQARIIELVQNRKARLDDVAGKVAQFLDHLAEYRSALITAAVTGQIRELR